MTHQEFIAERIRTMEESVAYFSSKNKAVREQWVASRFLRALRLRFAEEDVICSQQDPPDILFRDAQFEIKEVLDADRPRHAEFKLALVRAREATDSRELLEEFTPKRMNPYQIAERLHVHLRELCNHYPVAVRQEFDLLFYVNLRDSFFEQGEMPAPAEFAMYGWRSISAYENSISLVFCAERGAPSFLRRYLSKYSARRKSQLHDGI